MAAKKARTGFQPEDIAIDQVVLYPDASGVQHRGIVKEAFAPLDQFWVADEETLEILRNEEGEVAQFSANDLAPAPAKAPTETPPPGAPRNAPDSADGGGKGGDGRSFVRVLLIGAQAQMIEVLQQFGQPDVAQRREPQMLLAVPCANCKCGPACARYDANKTKTCEKSTCPLLQLATDGIDGEMMSLAKKLRPDITMDVRAYHLKQAIEQIGPDIKRMDGRLGPEYYCLSAVTFPYGPKDFESAAGSEKMYMKDVRCQIDLGASAEAVVEAGDASLEDTARRTLNETCHLRLSDGLWSDDMQFKLRRKLGVDTPLKFWDGPHTKVFVMLVPADAKISSQDGVVTFSEPGAPAGSVRSTPVSGGSGGAKTIEDWKLEQDQFRHLPKLPHGWIHIRSRAGEVYYWNTKTDKSSLEHPLPEGWTKEKSKTTGKVYYFNAKKRKSSFEIPSAE